MFKSDRPCPCLSGTPYSICCQPLHEDKKIAHSAEQLMRSRYSAFYLGKIDYLIATLHSEKRQANDAQILKNTIEQTQWLGLKIVNHKAKDLTATVEFIAYFQGEPVGQLHERSNFIKDNNRWFYVDGEQLAPIKLSRNECCFCGSGKKLKRCHSFN